MHIHLDPVGGLAGDMFLAAVLHAWPDLTEPVFAAMRTAGLPEDWSVETIAGTSAGITGMRVTITGDARHHDHATGSFREIRARLEAAGLPAGVRDRAVDIFHRLAVAEGEIHGKPVDAVHFHEIADWDSVADIVGAAAAIDALGATGWSVGDLPMGSGTVQTAHGRIPVPAPATALLLRGYRMVDDGFAGERITPTGAAILAHLRASQDARRPAGQLSRTGHGLGTREMPGLANMVRLLAFDTAAEPEPDPVAMPGDVGIIEFEVDDQTPEDLAAGIDQLRATDGVLDVVQYMVNGKKGRVAVAVRVLCRPDCLEQAADACFLQTTTIGLRCRVERRIVLQRQCIGIDGQGAKTARRPDGTLTVKADMDGLASRSRNQAERGRYRRNIESQGEVAEQGSGDNGDN